jgi:RNA ligase-like protein
MLLSRDEFRKAVFERDRYECVVCGVDAQDAHHIVERRLFPDGGYYLSNGASLCGACHLKAESTEISCDELRQRCNIREIILPPHFYSDQPIDKWGNPILPNGQRLKGELFHDESVQKVIKPVLHLFTDRVKYPRTYHLPWSPGATDDDRKMEDLVGFVGEEVIVSVKMDGEQTTLYRNGFHARSIDTPSHPSRDWLWSLHRKIGGDLPEGWRICGENLYAKHSIHYQNLPAHFLVFGIWNEKNVCFSWDETVEWCRLLDLLTVPVLERRLWDEKAMRTLDVPIYDGDPCEGYVVRVARSFAFREFKEVVGKYVRQGHVHTHGHWMREAVERNGMKANEG